MEMLTLGTWLSGLSLFFLYLIYDGYGRVLQALRLLLGERQPTSRAGVPLAAAVTVIIPAYNEERRIRAKLENVLAQGYPADKLEVIVVSDGSADRTEAIANEYSGRVTLIRTAGRQGKSRAQNQAVARAGGEILVLTDMAVVMAPDCVSQLVTPFANARIGCVTSRVLHTSENSVTGKDQGRYWDYEYKLRRLESELGILATTSGPAMAIRRDLWKDLAADFGDDCVLPLDVILQARRVVQAERAVAWDENLETAEKEFRARVRMTVRNWLGTFSRGQLLNPFRYPGYAFALWLHKILRWLSPLFIVGLLAGTALVTWGGGSKVPLALATLFLALGAAGVIGLYRRQRWPLLATVGSFLLVNYAFLVGLIRVSRGHTIKIYQN
jgi:cellulose synthase/poly-beta-1,6-N-acetylglucosamine synthase-like glycosyltransferase